MNPLVGWTWTSSRLELLRSVHDLLVEEEVDGGRFHLLTPAALLSRLGVRPLFGTYRPVSVE